jgi:hypothetical protein
MSNDGRAPGTSALPLGGKIETASSPEPSDILMNPLQKFFYLRAWSDGMGIAFPGPNQMQDRNRMGRCIPYPSEPYFKADFPDRYGFLPLIPKPWNDKPMFVARMFSRSALGWRQVFRRDGIPAVMFRKMSGRLYQSPGASIGRLDPRPWVNMAPPVVPSAAGRHSGHRPRPR